MTFSRRAAAEMTRRIERICAQALGTEAAADALTWAGIFHGIGARLLRAYAEPTRKTWAEETGAPLIALSSSSDIGLNRSIRSSAQLRAGVGAQACCVIGGTAPQRAPAARPVWPDEQRAQRNYATVQCR